jgi:hypothetical protein
MDTWTDEELGLIGAASDIHSDIDAEYHRKYDRYPPKIVATVVGPELEAVTLKLVPRSATEA